MSSSPASTTLPAPSSVAVNPPLRQPSQLSCRFATSVSLVVPTSLLLHSGMTRTHSGVVLPTGLALKQTRPNPLRWPDVPRNWRCGSPFDHPNGRFWCVGGHQCGRGPHEEVRWRLQQIGPVSDLFTRRSRSPTRTGSVGSTRRSTWVRWRLRQHDNLQPQMPSGYLTLDPEVLLGLVEVEKTGDLPQPFAHVAIAPPSDNAAQLALRVPRGPF